MPLELSPEAELLNALIEQLKLVTPVVLLGYSAQGLDGSDVLTPAILVQLDSTRELAQQGNRSKVALELTVSVVDKTDEDTLYRLLNYTRAIRRQFYEQVGMKRWYEYARRTELGEVNFDIAANRSQVSFADMTMTVDMVIY